ncbi:hypothetical protein BP00DRAFT_427488 [Aspergillus indologenus CBS 114.80]|uniref:Uncharacterized protein n=1 Tax=Aspergillus indologenus CBS 114.80 TaxID=1450541 RepID=A0A2V5I5X0_9EURO|nr:hypothetical protein BP00DRAFT_427488 [Aspergillus indologenus CBS 114.80]
MRITWQQQQQQQQQQQSWRRIWAYWRFYHAIDSPGTQSPTPPFLEQASIGACANRPVNRPFSVGNCSSLPFPRIGSKVH